MTNTRREENRREREKQKERCSMDTLRKKESHRRGTLPHGFLPPLRKMCWPRASLLGRCRRKDGSRRSTRAKPRRCSRPHRQLTPSTRCDSGGGAEPIIRVAFVVSVRRLCFAWTLALALVCGYRWCTAARLWCWWR